MRAPEQFKSRPGLTRLGPALVYSIRGLRAAWRHESAFRQELALVSVLAIVAAALPVTWLERALLWGALLAVLVVELLNSALEAVVDLVAPDEHPLAGRAKDLGSAAVFGALLTCALVWLGVLVRFWP